MPVEYVAAVVAYELNLTSISTWLSVLKKFEGLVDSREQQAQRRPTKAGSSGYQTASA